MAKYKMFELKVVAENEAARTADHISELLKSVANDIDNGKYSGNILDQNGNTVGSFGFFSKDF